MACSRSVLDSPFGEKVSDEIREIFEICKNGDVSKVRRYIMNGLDLNIRDTAGRKSSPLHFAAGEYSPPLGGNIMNFCYFYCGLFVCFQHLYLYIIS